MGSASAGGHAEREGLAGLESAQAVREVCSRARPTAEARCAVELVVVVKAMVHVQKNGDREQGRKADRCGGRAEGNRCGARLLSAGSLSSRLSL